MSFYFDFLECADLRSQMPIMDGLTATKELRDRGLTIPIIGVSASHSTDDIIQMKKSGMTSSIGKPLRKIKLLEFLADIMTIHLNY